jgi:RING-variant domain
MASSSYQNPQWNWPGHWLGGPDTTGESTHAEPDGAKGGVPPTPPNRPKQYGPRTCRICLETVLPTFEPASSGLPNVFQPQPSVSYISEDPDSGRLIRPCKCKGSSRYVHERCLQTWRHADPNYGRRNYWDCPTCGFRYRLERVWIGRWVSSTGRRPRPYEQIFQTCGSYFGVPQWPL